MGALVYMEKLKKEKRAAGSSRPRKIHYSKDGIRRQNILGYGLLMPALILIVVIGVIPIVQTFIYSFQYNILTDPLNVHFVGLQNYIDIFKSGTFWEAFGNTMKFAVGSVLAQIGVGYCGAWLMNKATRGKTLVRASVLIPWAIPGIIVAQMWKFIFDDQLGVLNQILRTFGLIDGNIVWLAEKGWAMVAVIVADTWKQFPFVSLMLLAALQTIPVELYESARVDGASAVKQFFHITLPGIKPVLLVVLLFRTMGAIRIFDIIFGMTGGGPANSTSTLLYSAYNYLFGDMNYGMGSALSSIIFLIILGISLIYMRSFRSED